MKHLVPVTGFDPTSRTAIAEAAGRIEQDHGDSMRLIARLGQPGRPDGHEVRFLSVDPNGITVLVVTGNGRAEHRIDFFEPIASLPEFQRMVVELLTAARAAAPDEIPLTTIEQELAATAGLTVRLTEVRRIEPVSPSIIELTVAGGLAEVPVLGGDEYFYLLVPAADRTPAPIGGLTMGEVQALPPEQRPIGAYYTARRRRPDVDELDLWVVVHGDIGVSGWIGRAGLGDVVGLWGPRRTYAPPERAAGHLLVADETGISAMAAITEGLPAEHPVIAVLEVGDEHARPPFPQRPGLEVRWCHRSGGPPGTGRALLETIRSMEWPGDGWYAFGAAESQVMTAIGHHLRELPGMDKERLHLAGYWRRRPGPSEPAASSAIG